MEISIGNMNENFWTAPKVAECFGPKVMSNVRVMATRLMEEMPIQDFFNSLSELGDDRKATKLGDYPATKDLNLRKTVPNILSEFCKTMPFKRHLLPTGPMNTVGNNIWVQDTSAKRYFCKIFFRQYTLCRSMCRSMCCKTHQ